MTIGTPPVLILLTWPDKAIVIREKLSASTATAPSYPRSLSPTPIEERASTRVEVRSSHQD